MEPASIEPEDNRHADGQGASLSWLPLACPECRAAVEPADERFVCAAGHEAGRLVGGVPSFARPREGVDAELARFWSSSEAYYEAARAMNESYDDPDHASHRRLVEAVAGAGARRVLDVGCGTGEVALALAARIQGLKYAGVDVSTVAPRAALELGRPGAFLAADAERLPFADGAFDAVVSLYALEHFARPRECLEEMARVLRPGGTLGLLSLSYDRPWGTIPSLRLGLVWHGRKLPRAHPANLAVYAVNRLRFGGRQAAKQLRYLLDPGYLSFELVERPLVLDEGYRADLDAVHVVSGRSVLRLLRWLGLEVVDTSLGRLRIPFDFRAIARKEAAA